MRNWKFAISSADEAPDSAPILLKGDICEILKEAARLGYDAVEIHVRETDDIDYEVIKKCRDEYNIKISAIVTGRLNTHGKCNLMDDIPYIAHAAVEGIKTYIGIASNLDADIVLGWVRGNVPPGGSKSKYMSRLAKKLKILAEYAAQRNVKIFVEVINRYETNVFNTAKEIVVFLENYNIPNCYVHLDTFHMNIDEVDSAEAIITCGEKLGYMHFADNTRYYPGSGQIDFKKIVKALNGINYNGYLTVECLPYPDEKTAATKALSYLKSLI